MLMERRRQEKRKNIYNCVDYIVILVFLQFVEYGKFWLNYLLVLYIINMFLVIALLSRGATICVITMQLM